MNEYLHRKLRENNVNPENVIGFYWDGLHEDEGLVRCKIDEMPRILSHDYILLKCESCGKEFYKRLIDVLPTCHHCNQLEHWESSKTDYIPILDSIKQEFSLLGYYVDGLEGDFISEKDLTRLPKLCSLDYVRLKCTKCGREVNRRLNHVKERLGCPSCLAKERGFQQRSPWKDRLYDFEVDYGVKVLGYYKAGNLIKCSLKDFPSLTKLDRVEIECTTCSKVSSRGLYNLDYGCSHGRHAVKFQVGDIETKFGVIGYDSSYELEFIKHVVNISDIIDFRAQPKDHIIPYNFDESDHRYYPDFYLIYKDRSYIIEIKPSTLIDTPQIQAKIKAALKYCIDSNITYIILTEDDLFDGDPTENIIERLLYEDNKLQLSEFE